jgi:hypothetical protein
MENVSSESSEVSSGEVSSEISSEGQEGSEIDSSIEGSEVDSGTPEDLKAKVEEAAQTGASKEEIKQMIKEFDLKVNGKSVKATLDLSDEEAVKRELQKAYAFNDVSQENAKIKKALSDKLASWKANPEQALIDLGFDPLDFSERALEKAVQKSKMTPDQIENERIKSELAEYKEREERIKAQLDAQNESRKDQEALQALKSEINSALEGHESLKPNQYTERRVADLMAYYSGLEDENGNLRYPNVTAEQVLPVLEKEIEREFSTILENVPDKAIERFLSRKVLDRIAPKPVPKPAPKKVIPSNPAQVQKSANASSVAKKDEKPRSFEDLMSRRSW